MSSSLYVSEPIYVNHILPNLFTNHPILPPQKSVILAHFVVFSGPVHNTNGL